MTAEKEIQHIRTLQGLPVIGEAYLVRCVKVKPVKQIMEADGISQGYALDSDIAEEWIPVLGNAHEDAVLLNFYSHHYHFDVRFLQPALFGWLTNGWSQTPTSDSIFLTRILKKDGVGEGPVVRPMVCYRQMPVYPKYLVAEIKDGLPVGVQNDYQTSVISHIEVGYTGSSIQKGGKCSVCPHRKTPLNGIPTHVDVTGREIMVCPGHGLAFDAKTGKVLSRRDVVLKDNKDFAALGAN